MFNACFTSCLAGALTNREQLVAPLTTYAAWTGNHAVEMRLSKPVSCLVRAGIATSRTAIPGRAVSWLILIGWQSQATTDTVLLDIKYVAS